LNLKILNPKPAISAETVEKGSVSGYIF